MDELELLRERVQQLEKELAESRQILSLELYKLRVPLTTMRGFIRTLLDDAKEEWYTREDRCEFYEILDESVDRLIRMNNSLQGVANAEEPRFVMNWQADVDIRQIAEKVAALHQEHADKHTLVLNFEPPQILVEADAEQLEFLLNHLVTTAIKYSPNGGEVGISARLQPPREDWLCETLLLQVKDQGLGLSKEEMSRVGSMFGGRRSTQRNKDASGRPWQINDIVKAHHGKIWPESEGHGKGSTFNIRIPMKQPTAED